MSGTGEKYSMFGMLNQRSAICGCEKRRPEAHHGDEREHAVQRERRACARAHACSSPSVFITSHVAPSSV